MAIITITDQLTIIKSHVASIERAMRNDQYHSIMTFFEAIAMAANVGANYATGMIHPESQPEARDDKPQGSA